MAAWGSGTSDSPRGDVGTEGGRRDAGDLGDLGRADGQNWDRLSLVRTRPGRWMR